MILQGERLMCSVDKIGNFLPTLKMDNETSIKIKMSIAENLEKVWNLNLYRSPCLNDYQKPGTSRNPNNKTD